MTESTPTQSEIKRLQDELQLRDQLVQQLSQELFRLVKGNNQFMPQPEISDRQRAETRMLREQLQEVEEQVTFYQEQINSRDQEIYQLRQSNQELTDRIQTIEHALQEMPEIYRRKFEDRMIPIKEKIERLQRENKQLHVELQSVSYRLAVKTRRNSNQVDLPAFGRRVSSPIPNFGSL
ncbi:MAG: Npun_F5560 family protein [Cyanobacteria bacterium P01_G01_bin.54]